MDTIYVPEITAPQLGRILLRKCGNEGRHPYLNETEKVTLKFLRAAIDFIPLALEVGGDLANASFFFAHPGNDFAIKAGKENWEFYFSQPADGTIQGRCVRRPTLNYIWDEFKKAISRYVGTALLALTASWFLLTKKKTFWDSQLVLNWEHHLFVHKDVMSQP